MIRFRRGGTGPRWRATSVAFGLIAMLALVPAAPVAAAEPTDMVIQWNRIALGAIQNANGATPPGLNQPPPLAPIHLAMVHTAIYDAVNAIDPTNVPYLDALSAPATASKAAAIATAAHHVLVGLVPASLPLVKDDLDTKYGNSLEAIPDGAAKTDGIAVGAAAARAILDDRAGDGRFGTRTFPVGTQKGEWRPVPPMSTNVFAWIADVRPFALSGASQFRTEGPPALESEQYAEEFNEVKLLGGTNSTRNPAQAALATFVSTNPYGAINRSLGDVALGKGLSNNEQARLFAMTSMSSADAAIGCWDSKVHWNFWRPQTAIQLADTDGNDATAPDTTWTSLVATPGYPDVPSGYNCIAASMMYSARAYFGTNKVSFTLNNTASIPPTSRSYDRFTDFVDDAIVGRILIGLHFRSADEQGAWLGRKVAQWVTKHEFDALD